MLLVLRTAGEVAHARLGVSLISGHADRLGWMTPPVSAEGDAALVAALKRLMA